jgi:hypothetical protein
VFAVTAVAHAQQGERGTTVNLRGQITAFKSGLLTIKSLDGETLTMSVPQKARISSLTRVDFAELKKGDFIASAGMRQKDGTLKAIDVRIFPAKGRHPPEVHRKFHLGPESTMTNATVDAFVGGVSGRTFKVKYKGGQQTIVVPAEAMVMRQNPGKTDLLKPGAHISVVGSKGKDGKIGVVRMAVGMKGLVPPT